MSTNKHGDAIGGEFILCRVARQISILACMQAAVLVNDQGAWLLTT